METIANEAKSPVTGLTIVLARVLDDQRTFPLKPSCFLKGNRAQLDVPGVFCRIEFDLHMIIVSTIILTSTAFQHTDLAQPTAQADHQPHGVFG
jgi:hypothetical protein